MTAAEVQARSDERYAVMMRKYQDYRMSMMLSKAERAAIMRLARLAKLHGLRAEHFQALGLQGDADAACREFARAMASLFTLVDLIYDESLALDGLGVERLGLEQHELARLLGSDVPTESGTTINLSVAPPAVAPTVVEKLVEHDPKGRIIRVVETSTPVSSAADS